MIKNLTFDSIQEKYDGIINIYNHLADDESKFLFFSRIGYALEPNLDDWVSCVSEKYEDWRIEDCISNHKECIVIYGTGHDGQFVYRMLKQCGLQPVCFCETKRTKDMQNGIDVLDFKETRKKYPNAYYLVCSSKFQNEIKDILEKEVGQENIYVPKYIYPTVIRGNQYFDVFEPTENEIFIDAGGYDGQTTEEFIHWSKGNYRGIYIVEPIDQNYKDICVKFNRDSNINVIHGAVWDSNDKLGFFVDEENKAGSYIDIHNSNTVKGVVIDDLTLDNVTMIKMDIEGSEVRAICGAKNTIEKWHPRLAICIYHKLWDVYEISNLILNIFPKYKLFIRQYDYFISETVLYAVP